MSDIKKIFRSRFENGYIMEADFCLAPTTKVLTTDFKWVPISSVKEGDKLIGFDEHTRTHDGRKFKITKVEKTKTLIKSCIRLSTSEGTIVCSEDHMFLATEKGQCPLHWVKASNLKIGEHIPKVMEVWETLHNNETGWMAGFLDGEGYISNSSQIGYGQNGDGDNKLVLDRANELLIKYTNNTQLRISDKRRCKVVRPAGLRTGWQTVGVFQPIRLKEKLLRTLETGASLRSKRNRKAIIRNIEYIGEHEVCAVQTDSHTFLAEGLLSHNCQLEIFALAFLSGDEQLKEDLRNGVDIHSVNAANLFGYAVLDFCSMILNGEQKEIELRKIAKTLTFQLQYGAGYKTMAVQNDISEDTAKKFIKVYYDRYKGVKQWHDSLIKEVNFGRKISTKHTKTGLPAGVCKMKSITGRIYTFYEQDGFRGETSFSPTQVKNYPVQGFATGDIVPMVLGELHKEIYKEEMQDNALLINTVHDSILLDVKQPYVHFTSKLVKEIMEKAPVFLKRYFDIDFDLELKAEVKVGKTWLNMEKYDETRSYS